jgi:spermidine synthase
MGEWGFVLGKKTEMTQAQLKKQFLELKVDGISTRWLNSDALPLISSFGKDYFNKNEEDTVRINRVHSPVINRYYEEGIWDHY